MSFTLQVDPVRWLWAAGAILTWLLIVLLPWLRRRRGRARARLSTPATHAVRIAYASQNGTAAALAEELRRRLPEDSRPPAALPLEELDQAMLSRTRYLCCVASTTGDGDAPDHVHGFLRHVMAGRPDLSGLHYSLLALGDRSYPNFCGFGKALDSWLHQCRAQRAHPTIEVDRLEESALSKWREETAAFLSLLPADEDGPSSDPQSEQWQLIERTLLNPGSPGAPIFHLHCRPLSACPCWQAGDIARVAVPLPKSEDICWREYTLCSLPFEGQASFLLRETRHPDGRLGAGARLLGHELQPGQTLRLRIRSNPSFHDPEPERPMILIGHGTGLAGLVVHLKARRQLRREGSVKPGETWLLYGERSVEHDNHLGDKLESWLDEGVLQRLDRAYSRDADTSARYVQDLIRLHEDALRKWVTLRGAAIYVCGRRDTMAAGVHEALQAALGNAVLQALHTSGRYRRDVY